MTTTVPTIRIGDTVRTDDDAVALAARILEPRRRPLVVVSTDPHTGEYALDVAELSTELRGFADLVLIPTGPLTRTLDAHLPDRSQVYGGAGRSYPVDFGARPQWQRSPLRFPGSRATGLLIGDALAQAHSAGVFHRDSAVTRPTVSGTVVGFVEDRALVEVTGRGMATVAREITYAPFPLDWVLHVGQEVTGELDLDTMRLLVERPAPTPQELGDAFAHRCVTLAFVKKVTQRRATLQLHPSHEAVARQADVSSNPLDTVDLLLAEGEVVAVRVVHLSDGALHLSLSDVDDDEPIVPSLVLTAGGRPWLEEGRALVADVHDQPAPPVRSPAPPAPGPAPPLPAPVPPVPGSASAVPAPATPVAAPAPPVPGPGPRKVMTGPVPTAGATDAGTRPHAPATGVRPGAPAAPAPAPGTALHSTQLQLAAAQARIAELETRLSGGADAGVEQLKVRLHAAERRLREELAERGELQRRLADAHAQRQASTRAMRAARKLPKTEAGVPSLRDRRALWATDDEWVRHEVYLAWVGRVSASDRQTWPLRDYVIGPQFAASLLTLDARQAEKALRAAVDAITGRIRDIASREAHPLRTGDGGDDPDTVRDDGAKCWRAYIEHKTPAARRIHYWVLPGGTIELSRVVTHDDVEP